MIELNPNLDHQSCFPYFELHTYLYVYIYMLKTYASHNYVYFHYNFLWI